MTRRQGHGLILALVVIAVMMMALGLLASSMQMGMWEVRREVRTVTLVALSDAAVAETLAGLAADDAFAGVDEYEFGGGRISSRVKSLGEWRVEIAALAILDGQQRELRVAVRLTGSGPVVLGLRPVER